MGVCNLDEEIMLRSDDGRQIAVVARKNYPGLLANILKRIPAESELIGAKIFTSTDHDFIIDLFEFKPNGHAERVTPIDSHVIDTTIEEVECLDRRNNLVCKHTRLPLLEDLYNVIYNLFYIIHRKAL